MLSKGLLRFLALAVVLLAGGTAHATLVTVDADDFAVGTNISSAFTGVTLSSVGPGFDGDFDSAIYTIDPSAYLEPYTPSTGSYVFGTNDGTFPHIFGGFGGASLRVDFSTNTGAVYLDFISNDSSDGAVLHAYDSGGFLVDTYSTAFLGLSGVETMLVTGDIAYVIASGASGSSIGFDNLRYDSEVVPEPATLSLLGFGLAGFVASRARRKKA